MTKIELAHALARKQGVAPSDAADELDRTVTRIVKTLRSGRSAKLPGIGTIEPGKDWVLTPDFVKAGTK